MALVQNIWGTFALVVVNIIVTVGVLGVFCLKNWYDLTLVYV